jgi:RHS repeat-associated protein
MTETVLGDASGMARPRSISVSGASSWSSGDYAYDGAGNIKSIGDTRYSYDGASRLTSWTRTSGTGSSTSLLGYDAFGNKYDAGISGCGSPAAGVMHCWQSSVLKPEINAATNHFAEMTYDADGNVVRHGTYDYLYDGTSMMTGMSTGSREFRYIYTADNERIGTYDVATQSWNWKLRDIGGKPLREFTSSGGTLGFANWNWANDYIYRGNTILASVTPSETQHFHTDHLGTPRLITGAGGAQRGRHDYEPFGAETTSSLQNNQLLKFTAHERDLNGPAGSEDRSYLDYMHARYYNPNLGRFSSIDPAGYDLHRPQTFNRYSYVANNPMNFLDPTGRCGERATFIGPRLPCEVTLKPPSNHQNWTDEQRAAENIKNAQRAQLAEEGKLVVSRGQPRPSSTQVAAANGGAAPAGMHLDHTQEIVLGGEPLASENIKPLDRVVNTSNGSRVKNAIAGLANGTVITKFNYTILSGGSVLTSLAQGLSYHEFLANQEIAHPGFLNPNDMLRWLTTGDTRATPTPCTYNNPC